MNLIDIRTRFASKMSGHSLPLSPSVILFQAGLNLFKRIEKMPTSRKLSGVLKGLRKSVVPWCRFSLPREFINIDGEIK
jgi:hypothetical protein